jgi:hypothetical protein
MSREILLLVDALAREKNVSKEIVFSALESAFAFRRRRSVSTTKPMYVSPLIGRPVTTSPSGAGKCCLTGCRER